MARMKPKSREAAQLGQRIKGVRLSRGLTLRSLATMARMDYGHLCRLEHGVVEPTMPTARKLAKILGVAPAVLLDAPRAA